MALFSSLHLYTVHLKPEESGNTDSLQFVPEKFNWYAFVLTTLWALYHRLWAMLGIMLLANTFFVLAGNYLGIGAASLGILQIGMHLWAGFQGNDFLRRRLKRDGYITAAVVSGESKSRAEQRFFDHNSDLVSA